MFLGYLLKILVPRKFFTKLCFSLLFTEICQGGFIVAYAGACYVERSMNNRPYIGFVNYCPTVRLFVDATIE